MTQLFKSTVRCGLVAVREGYRLKKSYDFCGHELNSTLAIDQ